MAYKRQPVTAWLVERTWLRRVVRLAGGVEATIEYDGRAVGIGADPRETIRINGVEVRTKQSGGFFQNHSHTFRIHGGSTIEVRIEIKFAPVSLVQILELRLTVGEEVVYHEAWGRIRIGQRSALPIPSAAPPPSGEALPIPTSSPLKDARSRPIPTDCDGDRS